MGIQKYGDQIFGDHLSMGTEFDGDRLSRGINFMGIVCPGGQEVGDRKSGDQMGSGPNASQPKRIDHIPIASFSCLTSARNSECPGENLAFSPLSYW